jgi:hypothetical protein
MTFRVSRLGPRRIQEPRIVERTDAPEVLLLGEHDRLPVQESLTRGTFVSAQFAAHVGNGDVGGDERQVFDLLRAEPTGLVMALCIASCPALIAALPRQNPPRQFTQSESSWRIASAQAAMSCRFQFSCCA